MASDPLIFIDANVFLNLYGQLTLERIEALMKKVTDERDRIIVNEQLLMEVTKNRSQRFPGLQTQLGKVAPSLNFSDKGERKAITTSVRAVNQHLEKARRALEKMIENPATHDAIYRAIVDLVRPDNTLCLMRDSAEYAPVFAAAQHRYLMHYPPRKNDESYGDALHWEWVVHCAAELGRDVSIVSQDEDFGAKRGGKPAINEFLSAEFTRRTKRTVTLYNRLQDVIPLPATLAEAEKAVVRQGSPFDFGRDIGNEAIQAARAYILRPNSTVVVGGPIYRPLWPPLSPTGETAKEAAEAPETPED